MVQGQWLLLIACSVDTLRIHVPDRGVDSVHQEDLRRAAWAMQSVEPLYWFKRRSSSLDLHPTFFSEDTDCYVHADYSKEHGVRLYVSEEHISAVSVAMLASLAKSVKGMGSAHGWQFCVGQPTSFAQHWTDVSMEKWIQIPQAGFTELHFVALEQALRQVIVEQMMP